MEYIWEVFLDHKKEEVHVKQADVVSPYYEMPPEQPRGLGAAEGLVEYNAMYRYGDVFAPLFLEGCGSRNLEECLFDIFSHYLIQVDLKAGLSGEEYRCRLVMEMLEKGYYGETLQERYLALEQKKRYRLAHYIVLAEKTEASAGLFARALIEILETGVLYNDKEDIDSYILYVGREKNPKDQAVIEAVEWSLLPLGKKLCVLWGNHFGICGEDLTMRYDAIEIL